MTDKQETYTLDQIRAAFWAEFNGSGERWFDYLSGGEQADACTDCTWQSFLEYLRNPETKPVLEKRKDEHERMFGKRP